ncbi:MAG: hypothetical protein ACE5D8_09880 [Fidelibacterota bacterium]
MKIPRLFLLLLILILLVPLAGQTKWSFNLGGGYYEPTLTGLKSNTELPSLGFLNTKLLVGFGLSYEFFYNARLGLTNYISYHNGKTTAGASFTRKLTYRTIMLETYFRFLRRFEMNFTLAPMINGGSISLDTSAPVSEWDALLSSFGNSSVSVSDRKKMTTTWLGFSSMIGLRYYLLSWLALDVRAGFMNNWYNEKKWKFQGKTVTGPQLKLDKLPLFSFRLYVTW